MRIGALGQFRVVRPVQPPHLVELAVLPQAFGAVGRHRLEQPVTRAVRPLGHDDQRAVHQPGQHVDHRSAVRSSGPADHLGRVQGGSVAVHGQAPQHRAFLLVEEAPAPVDHRPQGPLPFRSAPRARREQRETVVQTGLQLGHPQGPDPRRGHLQGQRDAVQATADRDDRRHIAPVEDEAGSRRRGTRLEQPHRAEPAYGRRAEVGRRAGVPQRRYLLEVFAGDPQRLPAGRQDPQPGCGLEQPLGQLGGVLDHMLTVVEHQQRGFVAQRVRQPVHRGERRAPARTGVVAHPEHRTDHLVHPGGRGGRPRPPRRSRGRVEHGELGEPHPAREPVDDLGRHRQGEPRLADTARPRERHQPVGGQQRAELIHRPGPADQLREGGRHVRRRTHGAGRG